MYDFGTYPKPVYDGKIKQNSWFNRFFRLTLWQYQTTEYDCKTDIH